MVGAVGFEPTISCSQSTCLAARPHPDELSVDNRILDCLADTAWASVFACPLARAGAMASGLAMRHGLVGLARQIKPILDDLR